MWWILIFTMWTLQPNGDFKSQETRAEFKSAEECKAEGNRLLKEVGQTNPASYFCFKKGEKIE